MDNCKFIKTSDEYTANIFRKHAFCELPKEGKFFVFVNNGRVNFDFDKKKIVYTNIVSV